MYYIYMYILKIYNIIYMLYIIQYILHMYGCMYASIHVCVRVFMRICLCTSVHMRMYTWRCAAPIQTMLLLLLLG